MRDDGFMELYRAAKMDVLRTAVYYVNTRLADSIEEMQQKALQYMDAQKAYFAKNKVVGNANALQMADSLSTGSFEYRISGGRFMATSKVPLENCPVGTKWSVSASTKGFFEKELVLYRSAPKDTSCAKFTPDFKNLGR